MAKRNPDFTPDPHSWMFEDLAPEAKQAVAEDEQPKPRRGAKSELDRDAETLNRWIHETEGTLRLFLKTAEQYPDRREFWLRKAQEVKERLEDYKAHYNSGAFNIVAQTKRQFELRMAEIIPVYQRQEPQPIVSEQDALFF